MSTSNAITYSLRSELFDWISGTGYIWTGALNDATFLQRIYDLKSLPTTDNRVREFPTADEDIYQHQVRNRDWDVDWVFTDPRFNLRYVDDETLLKFLCETVHPAVRRNAEETAALVAGYNGVLTRASFEFVQDHRVNGNVYYKWQLTSGLHSPESIQLMQPDLRNSAVLDEQIRRLSRDIDTDPAAAIAHCKELLESQFKLILNALELGFEVRDELPTLYSLASKALGLHQNAVPGDARSSEAVRGMLTGLKAVVQNIGAARNSMGTGHGREAGSAAERRHARLVFNSTVAIAEFIAATWAESPGGVTIATGSSNLVEPIAAIHERKALELIKDRGKVSG